MTEGLYIQNDLVSQYHGIIEKKRKELAELRFFLTMIFRKFEIQMIQLHVEHLVYKWGEYVQVTEFSECCGTKT